MPYPFNPGDKYNASDANDALATVQSQHVYGETIAVNDALVLGMGQTLQEFAQENKNSLVNVYGANWYSQTFTTDVIQTMVGVMIKVRRFGNPQGNITVSLKATDGSGHPTGADLASVSESAGNVTNGTLSEWRTYNFNYAASPNTKYAVVVRVPSGDSGNYIEWEFGGDSIPNGNFESSTNSGSSWSASTGSDFLCRIMTIKTIAGRVYKARPQVGGEFIENYFGFAKAAGNSGDTKPVQMGGVATGFSGLTVGSLYFLSDTTAGGIQTNAPGNIERVKMVGYTRTLTTELVMDKGERNVYSLNCNVPSGSSSANRFSPEELTVPFMGNEVVIAAVVAGAIGGNYMGTVGIQQDNNDVAYQEYDKGANNTRYFGANMIHIFLATAGLHRFRLRQTMQAGSGVNNSWSGTLVIIKLR